MDTSGKLKPDGRLTIFVVRLDLFLPAHLMVARAPGIRRVPHREEAEVSTVQRRTALHAPVAMGADEFSNVRPRAAATARAL